MKEISDLTIIYNRIKKETEIQLLKNKNITKDKASRLANIEAVKKTWNVFNSL